MNKDMDLSTPLSQTEAGRIISIYRGKGIVIKYREIIGFSPKEAAELNGIKKHNIKPEDLAKAAGRDNEIKK
jgi:hypothetical protein